MLILPKEFIVRIQNQYADADQLIESLELDAPTSIRLNSQKNKSVFSTAKQIPWCATGRFLNERPRFTLDPLFHAGAYYPQEAGSMFIDFVLKHITLPSEPICLDLCAAPGGKSTLILDYLAGNGLLIANEIMRNRAQILRENSTKWGASNCVVTNNEAIDFGEKGGLFDFILVDAPCSGEGMFRKDENARTEWSISNAENCVVRQEKILDDVWPALKQDGYLLYSTCTFNPEENERQLKRFLEKVDGELVDLDLPEAWGVTKGEESVGYACLPHRIETEGFYFALIRKNEGHKSVRFSNSKKSDKKKVNALETPLSFKHVEQSNFYVHLHLNHYYAFPEQQKQLGIFFLQNFKCMKWGVRLGEQVGKSENPDHEWALAYALNHPYSDCEVDKQQALTYLKGESIIVDAPKGWVRITHDGLGLGWVKNLGNRVNNYYPKEYRIRMAID
jgi:16S rRNA C967 or C1407 C5-methylase (RsmB/RsmF family)/NOL1/NOP2/fmu family ribosome biogenesis protein